MAGSLRFLCLIPWGFCGQVPWFLCQVPWGSCAEFPVSMTSFPEVLMPISLWFLCVVPLGSFAEFSMGRMPFPNVTMPACLRVFPVPGSLCFLVPCSPEAPEPGAVYFLSLIPCGSYACFSVVPKHCSLRFKTLLPFGYNACLVTILCPCSSYTCFPLGFYIRFQCFLCLFIHGSYA